MHTILNHRSIRKYQDKPIDESLLNDILEAGSRASNTGNMQVYSIIVSKSQEIKEKLAPCHFNQPMVKQAPVVLTFCTDINRFNKWCLQRKATPGYDNFLWFCNATIDAMLAAQNVCIAAEENGLGICYLGTTLYCADKIVDVLQLPKGVIPITTVTMGYPDEHPEKQDRLPLPSILHKEIYQDFSEGDIDQVYAYKESLPLTQRLLAENRKETLAQIFTDNRYPKADNIKISKMLIELLEKQGYMNND